MIAKVSNVWYPQNFWMNAQDPYWQSMRSVNICLLLIVFCFFSRYNFLIFLNTSIWYKAKTLCVVFKNTAMADSISHIKQSNQFMQSKTQTLPSAIKLVNWKKEGAVARIDLINSSARMLGLECHLHALCCFQNWFDQLDWATEAAMVCKIKAMITHSN